MSEIETRLNNGVLEVQFNRPEKKNAITEQMYRRLGDIFIGARSNSEVAVILITGQKSCFTAGNDLQDFLDNPPVDDESAVFRFLQTVADFPKPATFRFVTS